MRDVRTARILLVWLLLLLLGLSGYKCGGGGESRAVVSLVPGASTVSTYSPLTLEISVNAPMPIQAYDLSLRWDPEMLSAVHITPHSGFDDDGVFFTSPSWNSAAGTLDRVVDLRRGTPGVSGGFKVATIWFMSRGNAGSTSIELTRGGLADGSGNEPPVTVLPVTITIQP